MIGLIVMACASQEYVLPQAEIFEEDWEGSLSFTSLQGNQEEYFFCDELSSFCLN